MAIERWNNAMPFLQDQYEKLEEFLELRRLRKERFKQRVGEAIWECTLFVLKPIWECILFVLKPIWWLLKPILWPVLKPMGKILLAHIEWLQKRRILGPAMSFYFYICFCVLGYYIYDPSEDRARFRSQHVRMVTDEPVRPTPRSYSGPPRRPAAFASVTPRRPAFSRTRRRVVWLPNLGMMVRQRVEQNLMAQEFELETQRQAKMTGEAKTSQKPSHAVEVKAPLKQQIKPK